ncbi:MAG TPA: hypothetical protein VM677_27820 [Actinokineospora sp.]|nr:hypothetical protein [Actinokineospora sp.]
MNGTLVIILGAVAVLVGGLVVVAVLNHLDECAEVSFQREIQQRPIVNAAYRVHRVQDGYKNDHRCGGNFPRKRDPNLLHPAREAIEAGITSAMLGSQRDYEYASERNGVWRVTGLLQDIGT